MSRTDKTKPWRIRMAEHNPWAMHDHHDGICDLPSSPYDNLGHATFADGAWTYHCYYSDWNICYPDQCCGGCSCRLCSGYHWRKAARRRDRHEAKRMIRKGDWDQLRRYGYRQLWT